MDDQQQTTAFEFEPKRFFDSFLVVGKQLLVRPQEFFRHLPCNGSLKNPISFLAACAFLMALLVANFYKGDYRLFCMLFFAGIASSLIHGGVLHVLVSKVFKSKAPFGATIRLISYASFPDIVSWVPVIGFFPKIYGLYLLYLGLKEQHHLNHTQSVLTVIILIGILFVLVLAIMLASPGSFSQALQLLDPQRAEQSL